MTTKDCQLDRLGRGLQPMRRRFLPAVAVLIVATVSTSLAAAAGLEDGDDGHGRGGHGAYAIGLWGDLPYSTTQATVELPAPS